MVFKILLNLVDLISYYYCIEANEIVNIHRSKRINQNLLCSIRALIFVMKSIASTHIVRRNPTPFLFGLPQWPLD